MKSTINVIFAIIFLVAQVTAQEIGQQFFTDTHSFLQNNVKNGLVDYSAVKTDPALSKLIMAIEKADVTNASDATKQAFYINAYNLLVINKTAQSYPLKSVQEISGFFDSKKVTIEGESMTLNKLEKGKLLEPYGDGRFHFVLVCGALGCPPITNFAYTPEKLEEQLEMQTKAALNDPAFIKVFGGNTSLSQIFKWYPGDFGGNKDGIINFINKYRTNPIATSSKLSYYDYDWSINDLAKKSSDTGSINEASIGNPTGNNASRYIVSSTIRQGTYETKIFNNLYTQRTGSVDNLTNRSTFFTTMVSIFYGLTDRVNVGLNTRYRRVRNDILPSNATDVFGSSTGDGISQRQGLTALGPQIRYAPNPNWPNFSVQSSFVFAIGEDLEGSNTQPYIDWTGATWWTQFFNDFPIGQNFSLFTELDLLIEDIGRENINRISTPVVLIFSYNATSKLILYTIGGYSPYWQSEFDYFAQAGLGAKYQFTPNLELELLYTDFTNKFLDETGGQAATYNLGFRFNIN